MNKNIQSNEQAPIRFKIILEDIAKTNLHNGIIVNAANAKLVPGSGVDGAINRAAGPELAKAMLAIGGTPTTTAVHTPGFNLNYDFVIHAVAPHIAHNYSAFPNSQELLVNTYTAVFDELEAIRKNNPAKEYTNLAIPLLGSGVFGYSFTNSYWALRTAFSNYHFSVETNINVVSNLDYVVHELIKIEITL